MAAPGRAGDPDRRQAGHRRRRLEAQRAQEAGRPLGLELARELEQLDRQVAGPRQAQPGLAQVADAELGQPHQPLLERGAQVRPAGPHGPEADPVGREVDRGVEAEQPVAQPPAAERACPGPVEAEVEPVGAGGERQPRAQAAHERRRARDPRPVEPQLEVLQARVGGRGRDGAVQVDRLETSLGKGVEADAEGAQRLARVRGGEREVALEARPVPRRGERAAHRQLGRSRQVGRQPVDPEPVRAEAQVRPRLPQRGAAPGHAAEADLGLAVDGRREAGQRGQDAEVVRRGRVGRHLAGAEPQVERRAAAAEPDHGLRVQGVGAEPGRHLGQPQRPLRQLQLAVEQDRGGARQADGGRQRAQDRGQPVEVGRLRRLQLDLPLQPGVGRQRAEAPERQRGAVAAGAVREVEVQAGRRAGVGVANLGVELDGRVGGGPGERHRDAPQQAVAPQRAVDPLGQRPRRAGTAGLALDPAVHDLDRVQAFQARRGEGPQPAGQRHARRPGGERDAGPDDAGAVHLEPAGEQREGRHLEVDPVGHEPGPRPEVEPVAERDARQAQARPREQVDADAPADVEAAAGARLDQVAQLLLHGIAVEEARPRQGGGDGRDGDGDEGHDEGAQCSVFSAPAGGRRRRRRRGAAISARSARPQSWAGHDPAGLTGPGPPLCSARVPLWRNW